MIIIKLNGGLGNQMFEYAFGRSIQLSIKDALILDIEAFDESNRNYSLNNCNLDEEIKIIKGKKFRFLKFLSKLNKKLMFKILEFYGLFFWKSSLYKKIDIKKLNINKKNIFYGYWQSEKYFSKHSNIIKKELLIKTKPTKKALMYLEKITSTKSVCLHIRRGDFVKYNIDICSADYYNSSIEKMKNMIKNPVFYIFTDDLNWVKENIKINKNHFTIIDQDLADYETLRLMYNCKDFIISNSSFSWWAQYLSKNKNKIVFAPNKWYPNGYRDKSIYLSNWITQEV